MGLDNDQPLKEELFSAIAYVESHKTRTEVLRIISDLPENLRTALLLYYYGGLCVQEVAAAMGIKRKMAVEYLDLASESVLHELEIINASALSESDNLYRSSMLKDIFDQYAQENITDEQIMRILEPVIQMIRDGRFAKPCEYIQNSDKLSGAVDYNCRYAYCYRRTGI